MGFFDSLHKITKWIDPAAHYAVDAAHQSSTTLVGETSHLIGDIGGNSWLGDAGRHWDQMADKDKADFGRWATNTALTAGAVYGGMSAAGAAGSGGTAAGTGAGGLAEGAGTGGLYAEAGTGAVNLGAYGGSGMAAAGGAGGAAASGGGWLSGGYGQLAQGVLGAGASMYSAKLQQDAARDAINASLAQNAQARADSAPWRIAGGNAVDLMSAGTQPGGYFAHQFDANDLNANLAPNYAFMLDQGQRANQNAAGVAGGLVGGNALKGLQDYTQNYAQNAYQQAYQNYTANQTNIFNRLSAIAGLGQTANQANTISANQNIANANNYLTSGAAAGAAGVVGAANSANNSLNNYLGWQYLNRPGG